MPTTPAPSEQGQSEVRREPEYWATYNRDTFLSPRLLFSFDFDRDPTPSVRALKQVLTAYAMAHARYHDRHHALGLSKFFAMVAIPVTAVCLPIMAGLDRRVTLRDAGLTWLAGVAAFGIAILVNAARNRAARKALQCAKADLDCVDCWVSCERDADYPAWPNMLHLTTNAPINTKKRVYVLIERGSIEFKQYDQVFRIW